ncbi:MAG: MFS transporter [Armatimonadetes bacterium]|nr:MFS transporter [Armatimonadota bacterium]
MRHVAGRFERIKSSQQLAPFRIADFRLFWIGAFFSFVGTWVQTVAQGYFVYELTHDRAKLAMVSFCSMLPVSILGPFAGSLTDNLDRRKVLIISQLIFGFNALFIASAVYFGFIQYWHILVIATVNGIASTFEMPCRQSLVSNIVPSEHLSAAVPMQAMTFNMARIIGPAIGGILLQRIGAQACYVVNGLSYMALVFAVIAIKANLSSFKPRTEPVIDLFIEGFRYTWKNTQLRTLWLMECTLSVFGLAYLPLLPAFAKDVLRLKESGLGNLYTAIGIGAMIGLTTLITFSNRPIKGFVVKAAMLTFGIALISASTVHNYTVALISLGLCGMSAIMQFNTTNTLFQILSPDRLRGRVLTMHIWALSGAGPIALPLFGYVAQQYGVATAMRLGGLIVLIGALIVWNQRHRLSGVDSAVSEKLIEAKG